jgi:hypothetical protein
MVIIQSKSDSVGAVSYTDDLRYNYETKDTSTSTASDYANAGASPTLVAFVSANNGSTLTLSNTVGGSDRADYVRFTVPAGERLSSFKLTAYDSTDGVAFIGIQAGTAVTATAQNPSALKGYTHFGPGASGATVGSELVTQLGGPFEPGDYSLWIQQLGVTTSYAFTLITEPKQSDTPPLVQFTTTSGSANEGNSGTSTVTVQATLSAASTQAVTVPITYSGTATAGTDYTNAVTTLTIAAGQTTGSASFAVVGDTTVESNETVILTMGTPTNATLAANTSYTHTIVNDDTGQAPTTRTHTLTVLVDKGVLGTDPVLLKDLVEKVTTVGTTVTAHTVSYQGVQYKYGDVDALITTVIRDGEFTEEFRKEIAEQYPSYGSITYRDAVSLVGITNMDATLIRVAGMDGNFVA